MQKKILALLLSLTLFLTACTATPAETTTTPTTVSETTVPITTAPPETTEPPAIRYPLNADSTYTALAQELPAHIYTTTGTENGLWGTVYAFTGTVQDYSTTPMDSGAIEQIIVDTDGGTLMIANFYKWLYNEYVKDVGEATANAYLPYPVKDYCFPSVGETAEFIAIYNGYSGVAKIPMFVLGANPELFEMLDYPDPAETVASGPVCSVSGDTVIAGNLVLGIPTGFTAQEVNGNSVMLGSSDGKCGIIVFAADISDLDEDAAKYYLPMQSESFFTDDVVRTEPESIGTYSVGGFDADMMYYGEMSTDLSTQSVLDTTFTDSWYAYTFLLRTTEVDNSDYVTAYGQMLLRSTYTGPTPRFDFVQ